MTPVIMITRIFLVLPGVLFTRPPEKPLWFEQQDQNEDEVDDELLQLSRNEGSSNGFGQADDDAPHQGPDKVPHSPQHHHHKGGDDEYPSYIGVHVEEGRRKGAGRAHTCRPNSKGHVVDPS